MQPNRLHITAESFVMKLSNEKGPEVEADVYNTGRQFAVILDEFRGHVFNRQVSLRKNLTTTRLAVRNGNLLIEVYWIPS